MPDSHPAARAEAGAPLIAASDIAVRFGEREVLSAVDLEVRGGEIVTLVGPNGAGKSTLVRVALGQLKPDRGKLWRKPGLTVGYLPQRFPLDPVLPLTVRRFLNLPKPWPEAALESALGEVGADRVLDAAMHALSGCEVQRVLLARALLRVPELLVLDEPLQNVDFSGQLALFRLISDLRARHGCGVLMVSHDLHLVMAGTDRVVCLNRHVCCAGAPAAVSQDPAYLALFGPAAAEGLALYTHSHDHDHDLSGGVVSPKSHGAPPGEAGARPK